MSEEDDEWLPHANSVYYRQYVRQDGKMTVVCMQWFDEYDYYKNNFLSNTLYEYEEDAWLDLYARYGRLPQAEFANDEHKALYFQVLTDNNIPRKGRTANKE